MNNKVLRYFVLILLTLPHFIWAQQPVSFTLKQAVEYGVSHHLSIKKSDFELEKYNQKFREELSGYLPQVKADAAYTNNLKLITQIIPGEFLGQPGQDQAVQFGTKYNASANIELSQTLIDFEKITGQKIARQHSRIGMLDKQKTVEQIMYDISNAYTVSQVAFLQQADIHNNILQIDSLLVSVQSQVDNGFANSIDLKRLQFERSNLQTRLQNAQLEYEQSMTILKYTMTFPLEEKISIETEIDHSTLSHLLGEDISINSLDIQLLQEQDKLTTLALKQMKHSYLPKLSFNFKYGTLAQQNEANIFRSTTNWYPNSLASLNLSIPIFDGNYKLSKVRQLQLEHKQNELDITIQQNTVNKEVKNAKERLTINTANLATTKESKTLAEEVYALSYIQFQNGYTSLKDLLDANTQVKESQTAYLKAVLEVQSAELEFLKISGNIQSILK
jgi:outer membrane protein